MQVAVVGLGKMGSALARHLLGQGTEVVVWNRSPAPVGALVAEGAVAAGDLAAAWRGSTAVCTFLADDAAVDAVLLAEGGLLAAPPPGGLLLEHSTVSPEVSARVAEVASARGVGYVRCPVSGNPEVLAAGDLALIVSGDREDVDRAGPVLERIGASASYVGGGEHARVVKLAVNSMLAGSAELLAELVVLTEAWGVDRTVLLPLLQRSALGSPFVHYKTRVLAERDYEATFTLAMLLKDLRLAHAVADAVSVPMPVTGLVERLSEDGCARGLGDLDMMALVPRLQVLAARTPDVTVTGTGDGQGGGRG